MENKSAKKNTPLILLWYLTLIVLEIKNKPREKNFYDHSIQNGGKKIPEVLQRELKF